MSVDRAALKKIFDQFDKDKSGSVSTDEMEAMVKALKMDMSKEQLAQMMKDADPDKSGAIDFEEFSTVLTKQLADGGGGLANVFTQASSMFGWLNPFSMFGGEPEPAPPPAKAASPPKAASAAPSRASSPPAKASAPPAASAAPAVPEAPAASSGGGFFSAGSSAPPAATSDSPGYDAVSPTPGKSDSLFDRYSAPSSGHKKSGHQWTRTVRLRSNGVKLNCYLNTEVDRGRATVISLPEDCDTLAEVMPMIQLKMQLDRRMLYAAELYLPNGELITSWEALEAAARLDTAIVVGCGEPFDPTSIPYDILEFHLQGGGRKAAKKVKHILQDKRKEEALEKADTVRASGHGLTPVAVITSRNQNIETNRDAANMQVLCPPPPTTNAPPAPRSVTLTLALALALAPTIALPPPLIRTLSRRTRTLTPTLTSLTLSRGTSTWSS